MRGLQRDMTCPSCASSKRACHKCGRCNQCGSHVPQVPLSEQPGGPQKERGHQRQALTREKALKEDDLRAALRRLQHAEVNMWKQCKTTNENAWVKLQKTLAVNKKAACRILRKHQENWRRASTRLVRSLEERIDKFATEFGL